MAGRAFESALALAVFVAASASAQVPAEAPPPGHKAPSAAVATVAGTPIDLARWTSSSGPSSWRCARASTSCAARRSTR